MRQVDLSPILSSCMVWIPIALWIYMMITYMIMNEIDFLTGIIGIFLGLCIGSFAFTPEAEKYKPLLLFGAWSCIIVFPAARWAHNKRELVKIDVDALEGAYDILREKPGNIGATLKIARCLAARQLYGHATIIAEETLRELPRDAFTDENRLARQWRGMTRPDSFFRIPCAECGVENEPGLIYCKRCQARHLLLFARGQWLGGNLAKKLVVTWIAMVAIIVGLPIAFKSLPSPMSIIAALLLMIGAGIVVVLTFVPRKDEPRR